MGHSLEFILNHPVLSVALFIFIYLIISFEIKNFTKKYKGINCNDLVARINENQIVVLDTREKTEYKKDFTLFDFIVGKFECKRSRRKLF